MRVFALFVSACSIAALVNACSSSPEPCPIACVVAALDIQSGANDLVSASGCGQTSSCGASSCGELLLPPPANGGACTVTVKFVDGTTTTIDADWGAVNAATGTCGCTSYDHPPATVHLHASDGGTIDSSTGDGGLVAQCVTQAQHFATLCAGDDIRPCLWNSYAKLCATGKTQLLVDSMNCLDQSTCRTFSDPNEAATCLASVHATGESQASKDFIQNECTSCGSPCTNIGGDAEIVPYLTDSDVASLATCASGACTIDAVINQCTSVPDVGDFASCEE